MVVEGLNFKFSRMSGHSKWAKIHRQKAVADAKKGGVFTKLANVIIIATKAGGGNPDMNFRLKLAIDKAKASNMPKENIERAIKRGTGDLGDKKIEQVLYEGFGPGGIAFVVECLTDNKNRTSSNIKHLFSESGGSIGSPNSVLWQFENKGMIGIKKSISFAEAMEIELIDLGVQDIQHDDNGCTLSCETSRLEHIKKFLEEKNIPIEFADMEHVPKNKVRVNDPSMINKLEKFISEIENNEDVNNYYTNAEY